MSEEAQYVELTILGVDVDETAAPAHEEELYDTAFRLSREITTPEAIALKAEWGSVTDHGIGSKIRVLTRGDVLLVGPATADHIVDNYGQRVRQAVTAANARGQAEHDATLAEADRIAAHRARVKDAGDRF